MTPEEQVVASLHDFCARVLVACGDGADTPGHANAVVALAARKLAHHAVLMLLYQVDSIEKWELHEAVQRAHPHLDPSCRYCRARLAMFNEAQRDEEEARQARIDTLLAP